MSKARDIASAAPAPAGVTTTELGYVDGVTSAIQTQVDAKIAKTLTTTTGDIIYASGANTPARLGIGSSAQVLSVSGGVPVWATPAASGGLTLIASSNPSGASAVDFTSIDSSYKELYIEWQGLQVAASTGFDIRFNADSTSTYSSRLVVGAGASASIVQSDSTSVYPAGYFAGKHCDSSSYYAVSRGYIRIFNANSTTKYKSFEGKVSYYDGSVGWKTYFNVGDFQSTATISQINLVRLLGSGTITTLANGVINLWGAK